MNASTKTALASQYAAALAMLGRAIEACPEALWDDASASTFGRFWYIAYHTLFWTDCYLSPSVEGFHPPAPFGLEEFDPAGAFPATVPTKAQLMDWLAHDRDKCAARIAALDESAARARFVTGWVDLEVEELLFDNLRHVQHHVGQLQMLMRQHGAEPPRWVTKLPS